MKVICDGDPGHDDMFAFLLAAKHLDLIGITTVSGNQPVDKVTSNALKIAEFAGITSIPVAKGLSRPLLNAPLHAPEIHGETGLDGRPLPEPTTALSPMDAVDFIVSNAMASDGIILIPTGPLTNIAAALIKESRISERISCISLMGGSLGCGNATPAAEFNIFADPEAAAVVFESGIPVKMFGLNVTYRADARQADIERIRGIGTEFSTIIADLLQFYRDAAERLIGLEGAPLNDPCAAAVLIDPAIFEMQPMHVAVELRGEFTRGMTVCDARDKPAVPFSPAVEQVIAPFQEPNVEVAVGINREKFLELVIDTMALY